MTTKDPSTCEICGQNTPEPSEPSDSENPGPSLPGKGKLLTYLLVAIMLAAAAVSTCFALRAFAESGLEVAAFLLYFVLPAMAAALAIRWGVSTHDRNGPPRAAFLLAAWLVTGLGLVVSLSPDEVMAFLRWFGGLMGLLSFFTVANRPLASATGRLAEAYHHHTP